MPRSHRSFDLLFLADTTLVFLFFFASIIVSQMTKNLRSSEERLRFAMEIASHGFWDWDLKSNKVYFSPQWARSLGYQPEEIPGVFETIEALIHPDDVERTKAAIQAHLSGKAPVFHVENRLRMKSGQWRYNECVGKVVEMNRTGQPMRIVGVDKDISYKQAIHHEHAARKTAEAANRAKEDLMSLVSHDLRSPVSTVLAAVEVLRQKDIGEDVQSQALNMIDRAAKMQLMLINDLVDWARIRKGKFNLCRRQTRISEVIQTAWDAVRLSADQKSISFQCHLDPRAEEVVADPERLTQVFWNLFSNAVKFTPEGGRITVQAIARDHDVLISVRDTGRGLERDALENIFNPYWQKDAGDAEHLGGLGLGLYIVREIVERHGGSIKAESHGANTGTSFTIELRDCIELPFREKNNSLHH